LTTHLSEKQNNGKNYTLGTLPRDGKGKNRDDTNNSRKETKKRETNLSEEKPSGRGAVANARGRGKKTQSPGN